MNPHKDRVKMFARIGERGRLRLLFKLMRKTKFFVRRIIGAMAVTLFAAPGLWAAVGSSLAWKIYLAGLAVYLIATLYVGALRGTVFGTVVIYVGGLGLTFIYRYIATETFTIPGLVKVLAGLVFMFACFSFGLGMITSRKTWAFIREDDDLYHFSRRLSAPNLIFNYIMWTSVLSVMTLGIAFYREEWTFSSRLLLDSIFVGVAIGSLIFCPMLGLSLGTYLGLVTREKLTPTILVANNVIPYLREMVVPTIAFLLGYVLIVFVFANLYWFVWLRDPGSFNNVSQSASLGSFLYFSMVTIATVGYGDITPTSNLTRVIVSCEIVLGLGWVTLVFAAVIAYLQPRFNQITKKQEAVGPTLVKEIKKATKRYK